MQRIDDADRWLHWLDGLTTAGTRDAC
jgi:hypothetical protein